MLLVQEQEKILYYAMGIRKKINKDIELFHNNYTSIPIDKNNICINCPNRIFHTGEHVKFGFGNPSSGNLFILPTFNNIKEIINILYLYINNNDYIANLPYHQIKIIFNNNQKGRYNNFKVLFANAINSFI